tara:strand:+ start:2626 stop:2961 length:336 start_codon:yes stop_codon:yes gene_type:complete
MRSPKFIRSFDSLAVEPKAYGCTDGTAYNYNPNAVKDDGSCIEISFGECIENALFSITLRDCSSKEAKRALKLYTIWKAYKQSLAEGNQTKVNIYSEQIVELCNLEYCESC